jgi:hypothetical protein
VNTKRGRTMQRCHWSHCNEKIHTLRLSIRGHIAQLCPLNMQHIQSMHLSISILLPVISAQPPAGLAKHTCSKM